MTVNQNEQLVERITKVAIETALEFLEKEEQKKQKVKKDFRLRNTKLLLKNYRSFLLHCEDLKDEIEEIEMQVLDELYTEEIAIESIKRSKQRTLTIVQFIKKMLGIYQVLCEKSNRPEEIRRYKIIEMMYISEEKFTAEQIAECQLIDVRTVYRDINEACKTLSVLIFGVDAVRLRY
ncbi:HTH domain-containing protein [Chengkuizengella sp. SCS-71B]|uniref:HTH domain-containing protein n=1 Tax=Chengkuizengella sp. SCS-71B TaxID=3115290 RepID=UPI0032C2366C